MKQLVELTEKEKEVRNNIELNPDMILVKPARVGSKTIITNTDTRTTYAFGYVVKSNTQYAEDSVVFWSDRLVALPILYPDMEEEFEGQWLAIYTKDIVFKLKS